MSRSRSTPSVSFRPLGVLLLMASFGILFAGCTGDGEVADEFVITDDEAEEFARMAMEAEQDFLSGTVIRVDATGSGETMLAAGSGSALGGGTTAPAPVVDLSQVSLYKSLRSVSDAAQGNSYTLTATATLRAKPAQNGESLGGLEAGTAVEVSEFTDAAWAKVKVTSSGKEGYVSSRLIAKLTTDAKLEAERKIFDGMYFVDFAFVNVRAQPDQKSEKLGELAGQSILRPSTIDAQWAKVVFGGKEGYVSSTYLSPFLPTFIVRQENYTLPILHYKLGQPGMLEAMEQHLARLRLEGVVFQTTKSVQDILLRQQTDPSARLQANSVLVAVTGITPENVKAVSDTLGRTGARGTLFIETKHVGIAGITEKQLLTLVANGLDIQAATHTGDDLRAMTNAQVELELKQSRKLLEDMTRRPVFAVAYPQGGVNDRVMQIAADSGYLFGIVSGMEKTFSRAQLLKMPSLDIFPTMTVDEVAAMAKGS